jgi:Domain of Unknown Function (DUF1080)
MLPRLLPLALCALSLPLLLQAEPEKTWPRHSMERPRPEVVEPQYDGKPVPPPAGAVVLFDGTELSKWKQEPPKNASDTSGKPLWAVKDGFMEITPKSGTLRTIDPIPGSVHLHIEWATPAEVKGSSQGRGNSGVFIEGYPEVQVLDSWKNDTYPDGQAAALYGQHPPRVNACKAPGEWQAYDILVERAVVKDGKVERKARLTVRHNGVLVHENREFDDKRAEGRLSFQDHGNPVRYRNIWYAPLP